ncbi:MAG: flagellar FliJ family protein [Cyanobacteria bacterium P01_H01_bin.74]
MPKGQAFRLQAILDYRIEQRNSAQQALAIEEQKKQAILSQIQQLESLIETTIEGQSQTLQNGSISLEVLRNLPDYLFRIKASLDPLLIQLEHQKKKAAIAQEHLSQTLIRQKTLENLKDKHDREQKHKEQKADEDLMNEIAAIRFQSNS